MSFDHIFILWFVLYLDKVIIILEIVLNNLKSQICDVLFYVFNMFSANKVFKVFD
jgi:hypothetical protein